MTIVKDRAKKKKPSVTEQMYRAKAKALRRGDYDEQLFRLRAADQPYESIAKRIGIRRSDVVARADFVYRQFEEPNDGITRETYHG